VTGVSPLFRTDQPSVEATTLRATNSGYVVLANHSATAQKVTVTSTLALHGLRHITSQGPQALQLEGQTWKMDLGAYDAAVIEWK
jgi:hypothetical protein